MAEPTTRWDVFRALNNVRSICFGDDATSTTVGAVKGESNRLDVAEALNALGEVQSRFASRAEAAEARATEAEQHLADTLTREGQIAVERNELRERATRAERERERVVHALMTVRTEVAVIAAADDPDIARGFRNSTIDFIDRTLAALDPQPSDQNLEGDDA